ncbi:hypothetical protein CHLNCDRAFT_136335 [Chlorella variabilis]|uniref:Uncharacterized protein n=1 Tax=Chlorella variabilis TaxID=554065 RepID=E1ZK55_CHLVA|nr:hypothetical protein CHLNCDRAFT_136335 [Chlorella variabilis]EFN53635.1 hypothetical protein CHLNCDRAFT_136335 [Chlorella variabilis]|eukprot:XP_005845737.1 hypothetical protein CHLNCDRAFT_136335 [Chlorella variabilis]
MTLKLPRQTLFLEEELAELLGTHMAGCCPCPTGLGSAPKYCHLGLPPNDTETEEAAGGGSGEGSSGEASSGSDQAASGGGSANATAAAEAAGAAVANVTAAGAVNGSSNSNNGGSGRIVPRHRLAVLIPYRDREAHLAVLLAALRPHLDRQKRDHDVFVVEQGDAYLFNRGLLLNAAALLLQGSSYDYFAFQDVDTIPLEKGNIQSGAAAPHTSLAASQEHDFFGGLLIMTAEQFWRVNGFGTQFWGWGREDDNLRERLVQAGMWPPQYPIAAKEAGRRSKSAYFKHQAHQQASELRAAEDASGIVQYFQENPRIPYRGAKIMSSQPQFLRDFDTGLNTTMVLAMQPFLNATRLSLHLYCNITATPWCERGAIGKRVAPAIRHAAAVHAVVGS